MSKAKNLLGLIRGIREEGEMGPKNLMVGQKVLVMKDGAEVPATVVEGENGAYNASDDSYCVQMSDGAHMYVKADMIKVGETFSAKKAAFLKKITENVEKMKMHHSECMEAMDNMMGVAGDMEAPKTMAHLEDMKSMASELPGLYEDEMSDYKGTHSDGAVQGGRGSHSGTEITSYDK
jgi:hypothetical protein